MTSPYIDPVLRLRMARAEYATARAFMRSVNRVRRHPAVYGALSGADVAHFLNMCKRAKRELRQAIADVERALYKHGAPLTATGSAMRQVFGRTAL